MNHRHMRFEASWKYNAVSRAIRSILIWLAGCREDRSIGRKLSPVYGETALRITGSHLLSLLLLLLLTGHGWMLSRRGSWLPLMMSSPSLTSLHVTHAKPQVSLNINALRYKFFYLALWPWTSNKFSKNDSVQSGACREVGYTHTHLKITSWGSEKPREGGTDFLVRVPRVVWGRVG